LHGVSIARGGREKRIAVLLRACPRATKEQCEYDSRAKI
jgi:hypothetical protein